MAVPSSDKAVGQAGHTDDHNSIAAELSSVVPVVDGEVFVSEADMTANPTTAIQAAVNTLEAGQGGVVRLPRGEFALTGTVLIVGAAQTDDWGTGGIEIVGAGIRGTKLTSPTGDVAFQLGSASSKLAIAFRNLSLIGPGSADAGSIGIDSRTVGGSYVFDNVLVSDYEIGVRYYDNTLVSARHLNVRNCGTGLAMGYYSDVHNYTSCRFDSCDIGVYLGYFDSARSQVSPTESHAVVFDTCIMNTNGVALYIRGASSEAVSVRSCYIEQYSDVGIRVGDAAGAGSVSAAVTIDNCFFNGNRQVDPIGEVDHAIEVNYGLNVRIRGGGYRNHAVAPIHLNDTRAVVIVEPGNFDTGSGESGSVKLADDTFRTLAPGATQVLRNTHTDTILLGAGDLESGDGSATYGTAFTRWSAWALADAASDGVRGMFAVPPDWSSCHIDLLWSVTAGSGNVVWVVQGLNTAADGDLTAAVSSYTPTTAVPTANMLKVSRATTGSPVTVSSSNLLGVRAYRDGANGSDTFTGTAYLLGIRLVKAS